MEVLLPGGCKAGWNFRRGHKLSYSLGRATHPHKTPVRSLMVGRTTSTVDVNENRSSIAPNFSIKFRSLQQQRAGSNPFRGVSDARAVENRRSSLTGRRITAVESAVTQDEVDEDELDDEIDEDGQDDDFWDDDVDPQDPQVGDGEDGGGMVLGDAKWGNTALTLASETLEKNFGSSFCLFAFKLSKDTGLIRIRLDKLTDRYGSPTMVDIEKFSTIYGKLLEVEGLAKRLPDNLALEVSSPGAERVVRIPKDLERFKELPMYVRYTVEGGGEECIKDGIWKVDRIEEDKAVWKLANVRANREVAGKGRPLNKKQKEWRVEVPFADTQLVRLYLDV